MQVSERHLFRDTGSLTRLSRIEESFSLYIIKRQLKNFDHNNNKKTKFFEILDCREDSSMSHPRILSIFAFADRLCTFIYFFHEKSFQISFLMMMMK